MNKTMFNEHMMQSKINNGMNKEDYRIYDTQSGSKQKCFQPCSPREDNKYIFKHRYISSSRSVPRRSKRFVEYKINRSMNFDENVHNSSSDNSSLDENKYLSRSAKIMRALNFTSSPSYYGRTKIKRSLNFNLTPSPKRFPRRSKSSRKNSSINLSSSLNNLNKISHFDQSPNDSAQSSLMFTSSESIDENQNETPSQQGTKREESLTHSTPTAKFSKKGLGSTSFTPLLRCGLNESIDNVIYIAATPNTQALRSAKSRLKYTDDIVMSTPRNLFQEFHEDDDDNNQDKRSCTPENVIRLIPESMSAIKRSHKKERISRRNAKCTEDSAYAITDLANTLADTAVHRAEEYLSPQMSRKYASSRHDSVSANSWENMGVHNSEDDFSDTGSIFDYTEEKANVIKESDKILNSHLEPIDDCMVFKKHDNELQGEGNGNEFQFERKKEVAQCENSETVLLANQNTDTKTEGRSTTPELKETSLPECSKKTATPKNHINILQHVCRDSIKKSHKKSKDDNKRKLFNPQALQCKFESTKQEDNVLENSEEPKLKIELSQKKNESDPQEFDRAITPEKINSSRLLLSQFSSVKKSHKKDKHNKIVSGFLKRQEYFNRDIGFADSIDDKAFNPNASGCKNSIEDAINTSSGKEDQFNDTMELLGFDGLTKNTTFDKLSPSKRKKPLDTSLEQLNRTDEGLCDLQLQECDLRKDEFQIFTPLKRRRSLPTTSPTKEFICFYQIPSGKEEISEDHFVDASLPRCVTPVTHFQEIHTRSKEKDSEGSNSKDEEEKQIEGNSASKVQSIQPINDTSNLSGRSTPRNMSTTELYFNINSIKKSHKKNKRANNSRKENVRKLNDSDYADESKMPQPLSESFEIKSDDRIGMQSASESTTEEPPNIEEYIPAINQKRNISTLSTVNLPSTSTENTVLYKTPPNSFKTKSYMKLLQETSIKRSHKKTRDRKKVEVVIADTHELSDDGSIFGDEEKLLIIEDECTSDMNNQFDKRIQE